MLYRLVRFTGNLAETHAQSIARALGFDPQELEKLRIWRHVYLARYMRLSPREIEGMPLSLIEKYVATLSEFIKKEAGPTSMAETNFV